MLIVIINPKYLSYPFFRIEFYPLLAYLEMQDSAVAILRVGENLADNLICLYNLARVDEDFAKIHINSEVIAMANHNHGVESVLTEYGRHLSIEHRACHSPRRCLDVDAAIVHFHMAQLGMPLATKVTHNPAIAATNGEQQPAFIALEIARQVTLCVVHLIATRRMTWRRRWSRSLGNDWRCHVNLWRCNHHIRLSPCFCP